MYPVNRQFPVNVINVHHIWCTPNITFPEHQLENSLYTKGITSMTHVH